MYSIHYLTDDGRRLICTSSRFMYFKENPEQWEVSLFSKKKMAYRMIRNRRKSIDAKVYLSDGIMDHTEGREAEFPFKEDNFKIVPVSYEYGDDEMFPG